MLHCDPESLAMRSLGEGGGTPDEETHLATCPQCQAELASLRTVVTTARDGGPMEIEQPSPAVWDRIRGELALSTTAATTVARIRQSSSRTNVTTRWRASGAVTSGLVELGPSGPASRNDR